MQLFFLISGYLISFVLVESRAYSKLGRFYINRALRIFPLYWMVAIATLAFNLFILYTTGKNTFFETLTSIPLLGSILISISNVFILGQDQLLFLSVRDGQTLWTGDFQNSEILLYKALLVPQAWSLGVELAFYLVAPFILRKKTVLFCAFLLSLFLRIFFIFLGFGMDDPWVYRFFPTELSLFLLGAIVHQIISAKYSQKLYENKAFVASILVITSLLVVFYRYIEISFIAKDAVFIALIALALPFLFEHQRHSKIDAYVGHLSYPIYLWHMFVIATLSWLESATGKTELNSPILVLITTALLSVLSLRVLDERIQRLRSRIRN